MNTLNDFGELTVSDPNGLTKIYPTFTCGHCTNIFIMHPGRVRPRNSCLACGKWICENKEICNAQCTPIYSLADDHFEAPGKYTKFVPAIMSGASTLEEAALLSLNGKD